MNQVLSDEDAIANTEIEKFIEELRPNHKRRYDIEDLTVWRQKAIDMVKKDGIQALRKALGDSEDDEI